MTKDRLPAEGVEPVAWLKTWSDGQTTVDKYPEVPEWAEEQPVLTPLYAAPPPPVAEAGDAGGEAVATDDRPALLQALREATQQENSMARRMRAAIVEARKRLAKGRALWNGPCHECDAVLAEALTAACPVRPEAETASGVDGEAVVANLVASLKVEADLWEREFQHNAAKNARTLAEGAQKALDAIRALRQTGEKG